MSTLSERSSRARPRPPERPGPDELSVSSSTLVIVAVMGFVGAALIYLYHFVIGDVPMTWAAPLSLGLLLFVPLAIGLLGGGPGTRTSILAVLWLMATATVAISGGATSRAHYLYALVPLFAAGLLSARASFAWMLFALLSEATFFVLDALDVSLPHRGIHALHIDIPMATLVTLVVFVVTARVVMLRRVARREVQRAVAAVATANRASAEAHARRERAVAAKRVVLGQVGPAFRTPLETLLDATDRLRAALPDGYRDHAEMMRRSAGALVDRLGTFAAYTSAWTATDPVRSPFEPVAVAHAAVLDHQLTASAAGVRLAFEQVGGLGVRLGDAALLKVVLDVLVGHAIRYASSDRVTLTIEAAAGDDVCFELCRVDGVLARRRGDRSGASPAEHTASALTKAQWLARSVGGAMLAPIPEEPASALTVVIPLPHATTAPAPAPVTTC